MEHQILALRLFVKLLKSGRPRELCWDDRGPIAVFTDACYERESRDIICGLGGVFIDKHTGFRSFFSCSLDRCQREFLGELSKKQTIFEAETFCGVLAYLTWIKRLEHRDSTLFVDNEGTKFCLMKGTSENSLVDILCGFFAELEVLVDARCWLSRVPSYSNIAEKPSGGDVHELIAAGFTDDSEQVLLAVKQLFALMDGKLGKRSECSVDIPIG